MELIITIILIQLALVGVVGSVVPILPGASLILGAGILHKICYSAEISWWTLLVLLIGAGLSLLIDYLSGALGSRVFGASVWAFVGAVLGGLVGLFFGLPGLLLGPLVGAFILELIIARQGWKKAAGAVAGVGVGIMGNFVFQLGLAVVMFLIYLGDVVVW